MKKTNHRTGLAAEALCRLALRLKGYSIVAARYHSRMGEIDIIAKRSKSLALVEVKARPTRDVALQSITPHQQQRLTQGAEDFLARYPHLAQHYVRFDVMLVMPWRWPVPIADAWKP